jgi:soluble lytic murein transglycosylase
VGRGSKTLFITIAVLAVALAATLGFTYYYNEVYLYKTEYLDYINQSVADYGSDVYLVLAIIKVESAFNSEAESQAGALGLMQVMPDTAEYISERKVTREELMNPEYNIITGVKYFGYLYDRFNEKEWALAAYNAGETRAAEWRSSGVSIDDIPYKETREYVKKVLKAENRYRQLYYLY